MSEDQIVPGAPAPETPPAPAPAPEPPAPEPVEPEADVEDFDDIPLDELESSIRSIVGDALDERLPKPEPEPEPDPFEDLPEDVRPLAEKNAALEKRLAAMEAKEQERERAAAEAGRESNMIAQMKAAAKEFSMSKEEVLAVADYVDKNLPPEVADKLSFEQMAILQNPLLASRRKVNGAPPSAKPGAPAGGPPPAKLVEVGSGGDAPPRDRHPGPGKGFDDIHREAAREYAGKLFVNED